MGSNIRLSNARIKYGYTLKELSEMYGITYYQVWKMHAKGMLEEYMKWNKQKK